MIYIIMIVVMALFTGALWLLRRTIQRRNYGFPMSRGRRGGTYLIWISGRSS